MVNGADGGGWRGWEPAASGSPRLGTGAVTSDRLSAAAPVRNRLFPKVRSWFALGAPLELLSPLSVARIVVLLSLVVWLAADRLGHSVRPVPALLLVASSGAMSLALLRARTLGLRACRVLVTVVSAQLAVLVWAGHGDRMIVACTLLGVAVAVFAGLFVGSRSVIVGQATAAGILLVGSIASFGVVAALVFATLTFVMTTMVGLTVALVTAAVRRQSNVDPDTGLPNGFGLADHVRGRHGEPLVVATIVLRGLGEARDALGYRVGTELLRRVVEDLGQVQPADARLGRVDGDELVVVQPIGTVLPKRAAGGSDDDAGMRDRGHGHEVDGELASHARALIDAIGSATYTVGAIEVSLRAHVGLAIQPDDGDDLTELIRRASLAARRAMARGESWVRWEHSNEQMSATDLDMLADLRGAPARGELWVAYQPQIDPRSSTTISVEALLRWNSPRHGAVPPGVFIPLAERVGLVDRLTDWVLAESLDAQRRWRARDIVLPVSVNISPLSLSDPLLAERILGELSRRALPADALTVEVTETAAVDLVQAVDRLRPLHDRGVRVSIDDFGTGYTSLSVLPQLPLDELKVDQRFVRAAATSKADEAIVQSVRELAHRLGLQAVAEGVEDAGLAAQMSAIGFDLLQGYHFARPLAEDALLAFVARERELVR